MTHTQKMKLLAVVVILVVCAWHGSDAQATTSDAGESSQAYTETREDQNSASQLITDLWTDINDDVSMFQFDDVLRHSGSDSEGSSILHRFLLARLKEHRSTIARMMAMVESSADVDEHRRLSCASYMKFINTERQAVPEEEREAKIHRQTLGAACLAAARCHLQFKQFTNTKTLFEAAAAWMPNRAEPYYELGDFLVRHIQDFDRALTAAIKAAQLPLPEGSDELYIDQEVYIYRALDLVGVIAFYLDEYEIGHAALDLAITRFQESGYTDTTGARTSELNRLKANIDQYAEAAGEDYVPAKIAASVFSAPLPEYEHPLVHLLLVIGSEGETGELVQQTIDSACRLVDGYVIVDTGAGDDVKGGVKEALDRCELQGQWVSFEKEEDKPVLTSARNLGLDTLAKVNNLVFGLSLEPGEVLQGDADAGRLFLYNHVYRGSPANRAYHLHLEEVLEGTTIASHRRRLFRVDCNLEFDPLSHEVEVYGLHRDADLSALPNFPMNIRAPDAKEVGGDIKSRWLTDLDLLREAYPQDSSTAFASAYAHAVAGHTRVTPAAFEQFLNLPNPGVSEVYAAYMWRAKRDLQCAIGKAADDDERDVDTCIAACLEHTQRAMQAEDDRAEPLYVESRCLGADQRDPARAHLAAARADKLTIPTRANSIFIETDVYKGHAGALYAAHVTKSAGNQCAVSAQYSAHDTMGTFSDPSAASRASLGCIRELLSKHASDPTELIASMSSRNGIGRHILYLAAALDKLLADDAAGFVFSAAAELDMLQQSAGRDKSRVAVQKDAKSERVVIYARIPATDVPAWNPLDPHFGTEYYDLIALAQALAKQGREVTVYYDAAVKGDGSLADDVVDDVGVVYKPYQTLAAEREYVAHPEDGTAPLRCDVFIAWRAPEAAILGSHCKSRFVWYIDDVEATSRFVTHTIQGIVSKSFLPSLDAAGQLRSGFQNIVVGGVGYHPRDVSPAALDADQERPPLSFLTDASLGDIHLLLQMWSDAHALANAGDANVEPTLDVIIPEGLSPDDELSSLLERTPGVRVHPDATPEVIRNTSASISWMLYVGEGSDTAAVSSMLLGMASGMLPITAQRGPAGEVTRGFDYGAGRPEEVDPAAVPSPGEDQGWYNTLVETIANATLGRLATTPYRGQMQRHVGELYSWDGVASGFGEYFRDATEDGGFFVDLNEQTTFCKDEDADTCQASTYMQHLDKVYDLSKSVGERIKALVEGVDRVTTGGLVGLGLNAATPT